MRWGHFGTPALIFPTAGGDHEEIERFGLIEALGPLLAAGRIKAYSTDALAIRAWLGNGSAADCALRDVLFDDFVRSEVVPLVREDCRSDKLELIVAGASLGASSALSSLCGHPDVFRGAIGLSGVYDVPRHTRGVGGGEAGALSPFAVLDAIAKPSREPTPSPEQTMSVRTPSPQQAPSARTASPQQTPSVQPSSPQQAASVQPSSPQSRLQELRRRRIVVACGEGTYETPAESRELAAAFRACGVSSELRLLGPTKAHDWTSWRELFPQLLAEQV